MPSLQNGSCVGTPNGAYVSYGSHDGRAVARPYGNRFICDIVPRNIASVISAPSVVNSFL